MLKSLIVIIKNNGPHTIKRCIPQTPKEGCNANLTLLPKQVVYHKVDLNIVGFCGKSLLNKLVNC